MAQANEIIEALERKLRRANVEPPSTAEIVRMMNEAQTHEIGPRLQVPTRYVKNIDATQPFEMPTEARSAGALWFELEQSGGVERNLGPIPTMTVMQANAEGVRWDDAEYLGHPAHGRYLIIYDPGNRSAPITPLGFDTGDLLRMHYVKKPDPVGTDLTASFFDGQIPEWDLPLLVSYTAFQIFAESAVDNVGVGKASLHLNHYQSTLERALSELRPTAYLPRMRKVNSRRLWRYRS